VILSNVSIQEAIDSGAIVIVPDPEPRRPADNGECRYQTSAVDLLLGDEIAWLKEKMPINVDLRSGKFNSLFAANCERRTLRPNEPHMLHPGRFVLGKTHERVTLPIRDGAPWLAARVEGRSSYARCGLLVHFTAPTIHSGFDGAIALELMNFGPYPIALYAGSPICQLIVEQLDAKPFMKPSQFQGQTDPTGGRRVGS
jgi:dCTP deaminase